MRRVRQVARSEFSAWVRGRRREAKVAMEGVRVEMRVLWVVRVVVIRAVAAVRREEGV